MKGFRNSLTLHDIQKFPKADLHRHLDGSIKPELLIRLAKKLGIKLPTYDLDEFRKIYKITGEANPDRLFARFAWAIAVMRTPEGIEEVAYEQVLDLAAENIFYAEVRFAPSYQSFGVALFYNPVEYETKPFKPMFMEDAVSSVLKGLQRGMAETGIVVNLTLSIPREIHEKGKKGMASAMRIADLAVDFQKKGVVAIDLACDEFVHPPEIYSDVIQSTVHSKLKRDPHAGEMGTEEQRIKNIRTCLTDLRADGLGHALSLAHDSKLIDWVCRLGVRVERNPLSGIAIRNETVVGYDYDDLDILLEEDVLVSICSDDPALMQASLSDNFAAVLDYYDWGEYEFQKLLANAVSSGFYVNDAQAQKVKTLFVAKGLDASFLK